MKQYFQIPFENVPGHPDYDVWYAAWDQTRPANLAAASPPLVIGITDGPLPPGAELVTETVKAPIPPVPPLSSGGFAEYKKALSNYLANVMDDSEVRHTYFTIPFDRAVGLPVGCRLFYATWTTNRPPPPAPYMLAPWVIGAADIDRLPPAARPLTDKVVQNPLAPPPPNGGSDEYQAVFGRWIANLPGA
jgi:hypothetical protein